MSTLLTTWQHLVSGDWRITGKVFTAALYCVPQLCRVICTVIRAVLTDELEPAGLGLAFVGLPVQHRLAGQAYIFCCCTFFFLLFFDTGTYRWESAILYQQWGPGWTHKVSTDIRSMLPRFSQGENVPIFCPNFDPSRLWTAVFLNWGALSENKNKLVKERW